VRKSTANLRCFGIAPKAAKDRAAERAEENPFAAHLQQQHGERRGFKASGGVRTPEDVVKYYCIVKEILGEEWLTPELFRLGASSLGKNLLKAIEG